jgi:hypothetical protein
VDIVYKKIGKKARARPSKTGVSLNPWRKYATIVEKVIKRNGSILKQFLNLFPLLI